MLNRSPFHRSWAILLIAAGAGCGSEIRTFEVAAYEIHPDSEPWHLTRAGGSAPVDGRVCIIDSGIDPGHPDLLVDAEASRSFVSRGPERGDIRDRNGHGTHVAGTVAALDNGFGATGVASGALIVAIKVVNGRGQGYSRDVVRGIRYAASLRKDGSRLCDVANLSISAVGDPAVDKAVRWASQRIPFVLSAGNKGTDVSDVSPARVNAKQVYTVTAIAKGDRWPMFSNFGPGTVDFAAPGVRIRSTWKDGGYKTISGTSSAAAHVTGMLLRGSPVPDGFVRDPRGDWYAIPIAPGLDDEAAPALASARK